MSSNNFFPYQVQQQESIDDWLSWLMTDDGISSSCSSDNLNADSSNVIHSESASNATTDDEDSLENQSQSKIIITKATVKPKRKGYKKAALPGCPRILKHDLLRQYLFMFTNCMNSYDVVMLDSFLRKFSAHHLTFANENLCCSPIPYEIQGIDLFLYYLGSYSLMMAMDMVFNVSNVQMKQRIGLSYIELYADFTIQATQIYDVKPIDIANSLINQFPELSINKNMMEDDSMNEPIFKKQKKIFKQRKQLADNMLLDDYDSIEHYRTLLEKDEEYSKNMYKYDPLNPVGIQTQYKLLTKPIEYRISGRISFIINNDSKVIEKIQLSSRHS